jgi:MFS family permease
MKSPPNQCYSLCVGLFLSLLDTTIIATALFTIGVEFDSLTTVTWVALAYTVNILVPCIVEFVILTTSSCHTLAASSYLPGWEISWVEKMLILVHS